MEKELLAKSPTPKETLLEQVEASLFPLKSDACSTGMQHSKSSKLFSLP